jgi:dihydroxyacetone kinase-like protein
VALDAGWAQEWLRAAARSVAENKTLLMELDRAIGDADHGENLDRGFSAVVAKLDAGPPPATPAEVLKTAAMTLMSTVGGAAGPLYGTALLRAATSLGDAPEAQPEALAAMLQAARDGVVARGKAESGDKTMIDAWTPAVQAAADAVAAGAGGPEVLAAAAKAARPVRRRPIRWWRAREGPATWGSAAPATATPGAASTALILSAAAETAGGAG